MFQLLKIIITVRVLILIFFYLLCSLKATVVWLGHPAETNDYIYQLLSYA